MAVYYKFKSAKDYDSIPIDGHFISVKDLKEKVKESKHLGGGGRGGSDFELMFSNAQSNEEYLDDNEPIPKNTSVLVRRVPVQRRNNLVPREEPKVEEKKVEEMQPSINVVADSSAMKYSEDTEYGDDVFGIDFYAIPEVQPVQPVQPSISAPDLTIANRAEEDSKIKDLIETSALDWQQQTQEGYGMGRGFGRGMGGRGMGARGFGRGGYEKKTPPPGYICHRCKVPGHFIQHCPTNGDVNYDIKRVKPPTGIPKSMLMATPDGSYALPSGAVAVLRPNEAAFEKEIEGLPTTTRSSCDLPPELRCPLCKEVMKDAVLTSKCCFKSFCDKCIRDQIISKSMCICGATNVLADDLLPNKTVRETIKRMMESNNSSTENGGSMLLQVQDTESARCAPPKAPSPTLSATSKGSGMPLSRKDDTMDVKDTVSESNPVNVPVPQQSFDKGRSAKTADVSEATHESMSVKERGSAPPAEEEVQQNMPPSEPAKKKKKKKIRMPTADMQWGTSQDMAAENYMMPFAPPSNYNPYFGMGGMQLGMDGYMAPYNGAMPYMGGFAPNPFDLSLGGMMPQDPFGGQGYMMPGVPPQRNMPEFGMGFNPAIPPPVMRREEFEARQAELRRKREFERHVERERSKDQESGREIRSNGDVSAMRSKPKQLGHSIDDARVENHQHIHRHRDRMERPASLERHDQHHHHHHHRDRAERLPSPGRHQREFVEPVRVGKRKSEHHIHHDELADVAAAKAAADEAEMNHKRSVFSRISFPEKEERSKNKKIATESNGFKEYEHRALSPAAAPHSRSTSNSYKNRDDWKSTPFREPTVATSSSAPSRRSAIMADPESSDDERHFKRRRSRYESSPVVELEEEVAVRSKRRSSREERDHGRDYERSHRHR